MKNYIIIFLVAIIVLIIASLITENFARKYNSKNTSKSSESTEDRQIGNLTHTEENHIDESIKRYIEWRLQIGRPRRPRKNTTKK